MMVVELSTACIERLGEMGIVDLSVLQGDFLFDIRYATNDNFLGAPLYPFPICLLRRETADRLLRAQEIFARDGYRIKLYDGLRPVRYQRVMHDAMPNTPFVTNPDGRGSNHSRGTAVDMTVCDMDGNELTMPSDFDDFSGRGARRYRGMDARARSNLYYVEGVMRRCGLRPLAQEWWHYDDRDSGRFAPFDFGFEELIEEEEAIEQTGGSPLPVGTFTQITPGVDEAEPQAEAPAEPEAQEPEAQEPVQPIEPAAATQGTYTGAQAADEAETLTDGGTVVMPEATQSEEYTDR